MSLRRFGTIRDCPNLCDGDLEKDFSNVQTILIKNEGEITVSYFLEAIA